MFKHRLGTSFPSFNFWAFGWRYVINRGRGARWKVGGLTIENNFFILKIEKRNKIIVFDFQKVGAAAQKSGGAAALPAPPPPRSLIKWTYRFSSWTSLSEPGQSGSQQRSFFSPLNIRCEVFKDCVVHVFNASAKLMNERMIEGWKGKKETNKKKERKKFIFICFKYKIITK